MIETQLLPNFIEFITNFKYQGKNISSARNVFYLYKDQKYFYLYIESPDQGQLLTLMDIFNN